jgi:signal transduction histidine kinase
VITDQRMPGMSGVELLERVSERNEDTGRILLTGYTELGPTIDAINRGRVHAYVSKPWAPEQLQTTVRSTLERVRLVRDNARLLTDLQYKNRELEEVLASLRAAQRRIVESERLGAIGRMVAMIVHDFRGPLSVIRSSSADLAKRGDRLAAGELREMGAALLDEAERMTRMCSELLEMTRASEGAIRRSDVDVDALLGETAALVANEAARSGVTVEVDVQSGAHMRLDAERLRRALLNLAFNAIEAMPDGGVLRFSSRTEPDGVLLSVRDNGPGIPEEIRDRVFEPFVTAGKSGGSGLGLAIVKKVIDDHGGQIEVGKPEGGGTVFLVKLPAPGEG